jgi:hypothetical protein
VGPERVSLAFPATTTPVSKSHGQLHLSGSLLDLQLRTATHLQSVIIAILHEHKISSSIRAPGFIDPSALAHLRHCEKIDSDWRHHFRSIDVFDRSIVVLSTRRTSNHRFIAGVLKVPLGPCLAQF